MILKDRNIVITGLQSWDIEIGSNCKNIALEFSKNNRVLYVNPPLDRLTLLRNKNNSIIKKHLEIIKNSDDNLFMVERNLWIYYPKNINESINQLPVDKLFDWLNRINNRRFASEIKIAIDKLGFNKFLHFTDNDIIRSYHLKELLKPEKYIYYLRDNLKEVKYWKRQGERLELKHMSKADFVLTNSIFLKNYAMESNVNSFFVGQGCDLNAYSSENIYTKPRELEDIKSPIIGYIGVLKDLRLDFEIIKHIAKSKPNWTVVLIGPADDSFYNSGILELSNIKFLDKKPAEQLPQYLSFFDVAINPQVLNPLTMANYPRKIDEYLSMGIPVVATKTPTMEYFSDYVSLASNKNEYVEYINYYLTSDNQDNTDKRIGFAQGHSWENNVNRISESIA